MNQDDGSLRFLTSPEERTILFSQLGIDHLLLIPFTKELANLTAEEFIQLFLVEKINTHHLLVGYNHRFGKDRSQSFEDYQALAQKYGFELSQFDVVLTDGLQTSSSHIRKHLQSGAIDKANRILGYEYTVNGRVVGGKQLGRTMGYPTANVEVEEPYKLIPPDGVYAVRVRVEGKLFHGMLNIGIRPTVNHNVDHRSLEVHIFDFNRDIYSEEVSLIFIQRVRNEQKFDGINALKAQLKKDEMEIRNILKCAN